MFASLRSLGDPTHDSKLFSKENYYIRHLHSTKQWGHFRNCVHPQSFLKGDYRIRPLPSREQWGQLHNFSNIKSDFEYLHWPTLKP